MGPLDTDVARPPVRRMDRARATELRRAYGEYRRQEAQAFLRLIPRESVRPLYGAAREWAKERERHDTRDPMASLLAYVLHVLPLPPFDVWLADYEAHRFEHTLARARHPVPDGECGPVAAEHRTVRHRSRRWNAQLALFKDGGRWRGYIAFESLLGSVRARSEAAAGQRMRPESFRTANIFVDRDPAIIRTRFREYHDETLRGFLRSVLP